MANWIAPAALSQATFPPSDNVGGVNSSIQMAYALRVPARITKITVNLSVAKTTALSVTEWSNIVDSSPSDGSNKGNTASSTGAPTAAVTTAGSNSLAIGGIGGIGTAPALNNAGSTPASGWTALSLLTASTNLALFAYQILASAQAGAAVAFTWVTAGIEATIMAAFKSIGTPALLNQTEANFGVVSSATITIPATQESSLLVVLVAQAAASTAGLITSITDNAPSRAGVFSSVGKPGPRVPDNKFGGR